MFDLLLEPAKIFVEKGIEAFRKSQEHKNLLIAVQDRIRREVRFNITLLNEYLTVKVDGSTKHDDEVREGLVKSLRTTAFDDIDSGMLPLELFFEQKVEKSIWPQKDFSQKDQEQFLAWLKSIENQYDLLERIYHRIRLAKTFADCGKIQGNMDYIRFMLIAFEKSIAGSKL